VHKKIRTSVLYNQRPATSLSWVPMPSQHRWLKVGRCDGTTFNYSFCSPWPSMAVLDHTMPLLNGCLWANRACLEAYPPAFNLTGQFVPSFAKVP
jgi:hypothetical protein